MLTSGTWGAASAKVAEPKPKEKEKKSGGFSFGGLFNKIKTAVVGDQSPKADQDEEDTEYDNIVIGRPTDFKHEAHLGLDVRSYPPCPLVD